MNGADSSRIDSRTHPKTPRLPAGRFRRVAVASALALLVAALFYVQSRELAASSGRRIGVTLDNAPGGLQVESVVPGWPAALAGLRPGDLVLAIDGMEMAGRSDYDVAAQRFARDRPVAYQVLRGEQSLTLAVRPGTPFPWRDYLVSALAAFAFLALALLALFQSRGDLRARLLFLFAAAVAVELALPATVIGNPQLAILTTSAYYLLTGTQIAFVLHLASVIPRRQPWLDRLPWLVALYYVLGFGLGLAVCATALAEAAGRAPFPWSMGQAETALQEWGLPLWALAVAALLAVSAFRHPEPVGRQQAALVLAGVVPWALYLVVASAASLLGLALPADFESVQSLVLLVFPLGIFVAIFRYQLFDIELVVKRTVLYTALTGLLLLVFYAALGAGGALFAGLVEDGRQSVWVVSAVTLLLGLLFAPLRRLLQRAIDRRFFPERHALRQRLAGLAAELPALGKVPLMGRHLVERLCAIFAVRSAALLLADPKSRLLVSVAAHASGRGGAPPEPELSLLLSAEDPGVDFLRRSRRPQPVAQLAARSAALASRLAAVHAEIAVPLVSQEELVGLMLLGGKEASGVGFAAEELELLQLLAHHVETVFENARLFESATYESLTGLLRREAILEVLEKELLRAHRYQRPLTIGMADLDHFKNVNDRHGHLAGDTLLKRVAGALVRGLRSTDAVGRYGGEEFLLVLPETDLEGAYTVAEKVRRLVESTRVRLDDGGEAGVTVSIGLAALADLAAQGAEPTPQALIAAADRSLYRAKSTGRNRVEPESASG